MQAVSVVGGILMDVKGWPTAGLRLHDSNIGQIQSLPGGVGRNIAENLARLEIPVKLFGAVGEDAFGQELLSQTARAGVDVKGVEVMKRAGTGLCLIQLDENNDLLISLTDGGATERLSPELLQVQAEALFDCQLLVIDTNLSLSTISYLLTEANRRDLPVLIEPVSSQKSEKLADLKGEITYFTPNHLEHQAFLAASPQLRCRHTLVTHGAGGVEQLDHDGYRKHFPTLPIEIQDATGAGDAFVAGLVYGLCHERGLETAIGLGMKTAALTLNSQRAVHPNLSPQQIEN
jgi:pseudouridine kinase